MLYKDIVQVLQSDFMLSDVLSSPASDITDVRLIDPSTTHLSPTTLYIGSFDTIGDTSQIGKEIPLILCGSVPEDFATDHPFLSVGSEAEFVQIFNAAKDHCLGDLIMKGELARFLLSSKQGYLTDMVNEAALVLGNPLIVTDISFNVLAYSDSFTTGDEWWMDFIQTGLYTPDLLRHALETDANLDVQGNKPFPVTTCFRNETPKLSVRLMVNDEFVGTLVMRASHVPIAPRHYQQLAIISPILADVVRAKAQLKHIGTVQEKLFGDILDAVDNETLLDTCRTMNELFAADIPDTMILVAVRHNKGQLKRNTIPYLRFRLKELFPTSFVVYHQGHLTIVVPIDAHHVDLTDFQRTSLDTFLSVENLIAGVSRLLDDSSKLQFAFQQGQRALDYCSTHSRIQSYHNCVFEEMVRVYARGKALADLVHPALKLIEDYDRRSGTDLAKTLRTWLENDKNIEQCTRTLHLHRSSIYYRLNRVKELAHLDIDNPDISFQLLCSYHIQRILTSLQLVDY